jgi:hypothetical protein
MAGVCATAADMPSVPAANAVANNNRSISFATGLYVGVFIEFSLY